MEQERYYKNIIEYYEKAEVAYKDAWDLEHSMALHCGFWEKGISSIREALNHQNKVMAKWIGVSQKDHVLDAGCGIGGSSIYLSKNHGCQTTGITLVDHQVKRATQKAIDHNIDHKTNFVVADYCNTPFESGSFDVVWAIESVCYAQKKSAFIQEAYRLLKPGGRLIVADGFRTEKTLSDKESLIMKRWEEGYAVEQLGYEKEFFQSLKSANYQQIVGKNVSKLILPSARRLYYFGLAAFLYRKVRSLFGKKYGNEITIKNTQAAINQYLGLKKHLWEYVVFMAVK